jgi:hypothetical protein
LAGKSVGVDEADYAVQDGDLHAQILGLAEPWIVADVRLDHSKGEVAIRLAGEGGGGPCLPGMRQGVSRLRAAAAPLAASGHLPVQYRPLSRFTPATTHWDDQEPVDDPSELVPVANRQHCAGKKRQGFGTVLAARKFGSTMGAGLEI